MHPRICSAIVSRAPTIPAHAIRAWIVAIGAVQVVT